MRPTWPFLVLCLLTNFIGACHIEEDVTPGLCDHLSEVREQSGSPALGIIVANTDGPIETCVVGERAIGSGISATVDDQWHLGSTGKAMTATLVARLVEKGVVSWDDNIGEILGTSVPGILPEYEGLTYRHLLSHRGGLVDGLDDSEYARFNGTRSNRDVQEDRRAYVALVLDVPPLFGAGERTEYTNVGYVVAGAMLEATTGRNWEDLIEQELMLPLQISSAGFGAPGSVDRVNAPRGHKLQDDGQTLVPMAGPEADNSPVGGPAGSIHMNLRDYALFLTDHLRGARGSDNTLLTLGSYEILHTPPFGYDSTEEGEPIRGYAMGWVIKDDLLYHSGSNTIWLTLTMMWPEDDRVVVIVANDGRGDILYPLFEELGQVARRR